MTQLEARQKVLQIVLDVGFAQGKEAALIALTEYVAEIINCLPEDKAHDFSRWKTYDCLVIRNEKDESLDVVRAIEEHNGLIDKLEREHGKPKH